MAQLPTADIGGRCTRCRNQWRAQRANARRLERLTAPANQQATGLGLCRPTPLMSLLGQRQRETPLDPQDMGLDDLAGQNLLKGDALSLGAATCGLSGRMQSVEAKFSVRPERPGSRARRSVIAFAHVSHDYVVLLVIALLI